MAFADYAFLVGPTLKALSKLPDYINEAKADDGKVSPLEFINCWVKVGLDMVPFIPEIIRDDDKKEKPGD